MFDHFVELALKGLKGCSCATECSYEMLIFVTRRDCLFETMDLKKGNTKTDKLHDNHLIQTDATCLI